MSSRRPARACLAAAAAAALTACAMSAAPGRAGDAIAATSLDAPAVARPDASAPAPDSAPDEPRVRDCSWHVASTVQLTRGAGVRLPRALVATQSGVLVAWQGPGLTSPEPGTWVQRLTFAGAAEGAPVRMPGTGSETDVGLVSAGGDETVFVRTTAAGCELTLLDRDLTPTVPGATLPGRRCTAVLGRYPSGFLAVTEPVPAAAPHAIGMLHYDTVLRPMTTERTLATSATPFDRVLGTWFNGIYLVSTATGSRLALRSFDDNGAPVGPLAEQPEGGPVAGRLAVAYDSFLTVALAAWSTPGGGIAMRSYTPDDGFRRPPTVLAGAHSERGADLALMAIAGRVVVVWTEADLRGGDVRLRARMVSAIGDEVLGDVVEIGTFGPDTAARTYPLVARANNRPLVVYFAARAPEPEMQLYATLLECALR